MEEEMIIKAFELFKTQGYTGTIEDFRSAIERDETLLEDSKNLVSSSLGKTNGVVAMDATVTPEPQASENMVSQSEDISLEQYDAMTPDQKKQIKNYKLKQKLIRESAAKRKDDKKEIKETEKTIKEEDLKYNEDYNRKLKWVI